MKTYPAIFLIGAFSPFTFGRRNVNCCNVSEEDAGKIVLTNKGTVANIIITYIGVAITSYLTINDAQYGFTFDLNGFASVYVLIWSFIGIGMVLNGTILSIFLINSTSCCCGRINEECFALKYHYLKYPTEGEGTAIEFGQI